MTADLAAIEALVAAVPVLAGRWSIEPLPGLTNRSYRLSREGEALVVRLPGAGSGALVDRGDEAHNHACAAALGFAPPLLHSEASGLLVTRYLPGAGGLAMASAREPAMLAAVGGLLGRLHRSGARFRGRRDPFANLDRYLSLAGRDADTDLKRLRREADPARRALASVAEPPVPSHIDPAPANFLRVGENLLLIDWEYSAMAEPAWDLADFASESALDADAIAWLLEAYGRPASARERARLALWRLSLDLLAAAWAQLRLAGSPATDLAAMLASRSARAAELLGGDDYGRLVETVAA